MRARRRNLEPRSSRQFANANYHRGHERNLWRQGPRTGDRLFALRWAALRVMQRLEPLPTRLGGAVQTGRLYCDCPVRLATLSDDPALVLEWLCDFDWRLEPEVLAPDTRAEASPSLRVEILDEVVVELWVYPTHAAGDASLREGWTADELDAALREWHGHQLRAHEGESMIRGPRRRWSL